MKKDSKKVTTKRKEAQIKDISMKITNIGVASTVMNLITHITISLERKVERRAEVNMV